MKSQSVLLPGAFVAAGILALLGVKVFEAWDQVIYFWERDIPPFLIIDHPHFFRYLVAYPGFLLEAAAPGLGFTSFIAFFFALNVIIFIKVVRLARFCSPPTWIMCIFLFVHLFMNGRGVIAWTGWLLCMLGSLGLARGFYTPLRITLLFGLSSMLAAVSTGVFIVTTTAWVMALLHASRRLRVTSKPSALLAFAVGIVITIIALDYFLAALLKNLEFYGGGWVGAINMLSHGLGGVLLESDLPEEIDFSLLVFILPLILITLLLIAGLGPVSRSFFIALSGGLFGFTVLTLTIPAGLVLFLQARRS